MDDPTIVAARERGRARGLELSRNLNAAIERMKTAMEQKQPTSDGNDSALAKTEDIAVEDIEAPLQLSADDIVEGVEQDGKTVFHKVMDGERVLFATLSRPIADAFVIGWNAKAVKDAKARRTAEAEESDNSDEAEDDTASRDNGAGTSRDETGRPRRGPAAAGVPP